jgi:hypothetical protein
MGDQQLKLGPIVMYRLQTFEPGAEPYTFAPAIITGFHEETKVVNLTVFFVDGQTEGRQDVAFDETGERYGTWTWPQRISVDA